MSGAFPAASTRNPTSSTTPCSIFRARHTPTPYPCPNRFAVVPTWGTTEADFALIKRDMWHGRQGRPNITVLAPSPDITKIFRQTSILLVPSLWAEAHGRIIHEAHAYGVPVIASRSGGIPEAMKGLDYVLPLNLITRWKNHTDARGLSVPEIPDQGDLLDAWVKAISELTDPRSERHYQLSGECLAAYDKWRISDANSINQFELLLRRVVHAPPVDKPPDTESQSPKE
jgi:glycosyltransferase involved in cell wall biosynthesis